MKITAEKDHQSQYIVRIEVDAAELDEAKGKAAKRLSNRVKVPGFRPGKAPRALVERIVGQEALVEEATRDLMPKAYKEALSQENIKPIADPDFKIDSLDPLTIVATIPVEPTVRLGNYKEIKFEPPVIEDTEPEIEKTIERLVEQQSTWEELEEARPAQNGDQVEVELQTVRDGEVVGEATPRTGVLGKGELLEQLDEQIVGMAVGEEKTVELKRKKPETETENPTTDEAETSEGEASAIAAANATAESETAISQELPEVETIPLDSEEEAAQSGKPLVFKVKLNSVKVKHEPELNDEFAASVSDVKTLDELRERVRSNLKAQAESNAKRDLVDKIVKEAVALSEVEMPPVMIDAEVHSMMDSMGERLKQQKLNLDQYLGFVGKSRDSYHDELIPQAENRIKTALVLREVANQEGVTVDQGDLDREVEKMVDEYTLNTPDENKDEQRTRLRGIFNSKETLDMMSNDIFSRKLGDHLIELATGVKMLSDEPVELNLTADPNAASEASTEKLEATQSDIHFEADAAPKAESEVAASAEPAKPEE